MRLTVLAGALALWLTAAPAPAAVIAVGADAYRLESGESYIGPWEIIEKLVTAKDVAIVVMEPQCNQKMLQNLLEVLDSMKIPAVLAKRADFKAFVDRGVLIPHPPAAPSP